MSEKFFCNMKAQEQGLDPVGHAGTFDDAILIEHPLPWKRDVFGENGGMAPEAQTLRDKWLQEYYDTGQYRHRPLLIAPDERYSVDGFRRVMFYERSADAIAHFTKCEYLIPEDQVGKLMWALFDDDTPLAEFASFRVPEMDTMRDILVCTHGSVDVVCAKFGYPTFRHLQETYQSDDVRIWRVTHFGGHVFAPTVMDMPTGHYWAYVEAEQATQIIERTGDVAKLFGHYRGWAGFPQGGAMQAAERAMWQEEGWRWFDYAKCGVEIGRAATTEKDELPAWSDIRIEYSDGNGTSGAYEARVEMTPSITINPASNNERTYDYPQWRVVSLVPRF